MTSRRAMPNVILIVFDTARADAFEPYGAGDGASPVLAQLGRKGAVLDKMFAASSWTVPSHASMFTGLPSRSLGLGQVPGGLPQGCKPALEPHTDRILAEVFRRAGYATKALSANVWISPGSGFDIGFDEFQRLEGHRVWMIQGDSLKTRVRATFEAVRNSQDDGAAAAEAAIRASASRATGQPFFWFVNLIECHSPYLPPHPYCDLGMSYRLRVAREAQRYLTLMATWRAAAGWYDVPSDVIARMRHLYGRSIRQMDDWLGRVLEVLDEQRLLDDTLVVVTSDHGENLGEGELLGHCFSLDDRLIRVPFVWAGPGAQQREQVGSQLDLPRMLAEAVGIVDHPWHEPAGPAGLAVAQLDALLKPDDPRMEWLLQNWAPGQESLERVTLDQTSATDGRYKLVRRGDVERFFDLESDPLEVAPTDPGAAAPGHAVDLPAFRAAIAAAATAAPPPVTATVDVSDDERAALEERMRALGYM